MSSKYLNRIEREEQIGKELKEEVLKHSGEKHINRGQDNAIKEFSRFWAKFEEEELRILIGKHRIQVEEAIRSWIEIQMEKRHRG